jgi:hypothetical protein
MSREYSEYQEYEVAIYRNGKCVEITTIESTSPESAEIEAKYWYEISLSYKAMPKNQVQNVG